MHRIAPLEKDSHTDTLENRVTTVAAAALGRIATREAQIQNLRRTRDLLLRLLSGRMELSTLGALPVAPEQMTISCTT